MALFVEKPGQTPSMGEARNLGDEQLPTPLPLFPSSELRRLSDITSLQTGTGLPFLPTSPEYIAHCEEFEPIEVPRETILSECIKREVDRVAYPDAVINSTVYDSIDPSPFYPAKEAQDLPPFYRVKSPCDTTLVFESRFESGNLRKAIQVYEYEYDLILQPDYMTRGNTQWFYFTVSNTRGGCAYRFNLINMMKPDSLYNYGMKPCLYSQKRAEQEKRGWFRSGSDICYYMNNSKKKQSGNYYTLTFVLELPYDHDTVSIAHCYPYTYSDLGRDIAKVLADPKKRRRVKRTSLCNTVAGNPCELLTITNFSGGLEAARRRKGVVLMARVHPGESNASWMMKGLIEYLVGPSLDAKILRDNFVFKVIPMLNPDGVINGSYRCGLAGVDLNRCWIDPSPRFHPTIYYAKNLIKQFNEDHDLIMTCDLHGHSRKKNIFMYGCIGKNKVRERIFPRLMEKSSEVFSFADCAFGIQKAKESTARIALYKEFGIINSYTLESSFCGADFGKYRDTHFSTRHLMDIGHDFCDALLDFCAPDQTRVRQVIEEIQVMYPSGYEEEVEEEVLEEIVEEDANGKKKAKKKKKGVIKKKPAKKNK